MFLPRRFLIQILPAAVVAPLFFRGEIEFGVVNQSSSAFNHILTDVSLVVYQFEALAGFSAVVDRLGELKEVLDTCNDAAAAADANSKRLAAEVRVENGDLEGLYADSDSTGSEESIDGVALMTTTRSEGSRLLDVHGLTLTVPRRGTTLIENLNLEVDAGHSLLVMGPSGSGKTSLLRTVAGLWRSGRGRIVLHGAPMGRAEGEGDTFFVPQRPYVVLGALRDQLLYPTWAHPELGSSSKQDGERQQVQQQGGAAGGSSPSARPLPGDDEMRAVLRTVQLGPLLDRVHGDLDAVADWASVLSLGEQQRLAFARVLLAKPKLVLMDESTSALDTRNERLLYAALRDAGITYVSVGHRPTLLAFHERVLLLHGNQEGGWEVQPAKQMSLETAVAFMD